MAVSDADGDSEPSFVDDRFDRYRSRFLRNGLHAHELDRLQERTASWADWCGEFSDVGDEYASMADAAEADGNVETARFYRHQAALYYHHATNVWFEDLDERRRARDRSVELFAQAGAAFDPPVERLELDAVHEGADLTLPALLRRPTAAVADESAAPLALLFPGRDSTKEEMYKNAADLNERGLATLTIDGPGQGETWRHLPMTPGYADIISTALDSLEGRAPADIDLTRLGTYGVSLGGYYAPAVAIADDRIDACVSVSGSFTVGPVSWRGSAAAREGFRWACRADTIEEADEITESMTLRGTIGDLTAPTLVIVGELDEVVPPVQSERIAHGAPNARLVSYERGDHCCGTVSNEWRPMAADWLRKTLLE